MRLQIVLHIILFVLSTSQLSAQRYYFNRVDTFDHFPYKAYSTSFQDANYTINLLNSRVYIPEFHFTSTFYKYNQLGNLVLEKEIIHQPLRSYAAMDAMRYGDHYYITSMSDTVGDTTGGFSYPNRRFELIKMDTNFNIIWHKSYNRPGLLDEFCEGLFAVNGGIILCGNVDTLGLSVWNNAHIMKVDTAGNPLWHKSIADIYNGHMHYKDGFELPDKSFVCYGERFNWSDLVFTKYDSVGNVIWHKYYNSGYNDHVNKVIKSNEGGFMIAGFRDNEDWGLLGDSIFACLVKVDENGVFQWRKLYHLEGSTFSDIIQNDDNTYNLSFIKEDTVLNKYISNIMKILPNGIVLYDMEVHSLEGEDYQGYIRHIFPGARNGFIMAGYDFNKDSWITYVDSCGYQKGALAIIDTLWQDSNGVHFLQTCTDYESLQVDWGDGIIEIGATDTLSHEYLNPGIYSMNLIASRCNQRDTLNVVLMVDSISVGIDEEVMNTCYIQNPALNYLQIQCGSEQVKHLWLYDLQGKLVGKDDRDLNNLNGIFFIRLQLHNGSIENHKILIE